MSYKFLATVITELLIVFIIPSLNQYIFSNFSLLMYSQSKSNSNQFGISPISF